VSIGYRDGYQSGNKNGEKKGIKTGWDQGYTVGKLEGSENMRVILEIAMKGAPLVLADSKLRQKVQNQKVIHTLSKETKVPIIKAEIKTYARDVNLMIIERMINFANIETYEADSIKLKYHQKKNLISEEAYQEYLNNLKQIKSVHTSFDKAKSLSGGMSDVFCEVVDIFSPIQKHKIAKALLVAGNKRMVKEDSKISKVISEKAISYISDQLCNLIISNSLELMMGSLIDYATIIDFTEKELVGEHTLEKVMELVTARSDISFTLNKTFERDWSVDPNYSFSSNTHITAGVNLSQHYCVEFYPKEITESGKTQIVITVPEPEILSVHPRIDPRSLNVVLSTNLRDYEIKQAYNAISNKARTEALNEGILNAAREGTIEAINTLYAPLFLNSDNEYEIQVRFTKGGFDNEEILVLKG